MAEARPEARSRGSLSPAAGEHLFLTGFMGAGKTAVGEVLARHLGLPFLDLDRAIEARAGMTLRKIFDQEGESGFRHREAEALAAAAAGPAAVVATGGGVVLAEGNRRRMTSSGRIVWLNPSFSTILSRLGPAARRRRPLFGDPARAEALWKERLSLYRSCGLELSVDGEESPQQTAARILALLAGEEGMEKGAGCAT